MRELDQYDYDTSTSFQQEQDIRHIEEIEMNDTLTLEDRALLEIGRGLVETYHSKESTPELNAAFAKARAEIHNPPLDSENPHFRSKFSSLTAVINATIPVLAKHGIAVTQETEFGDGGVTVYTTLLHSSGEERTSRGLFVPATKLDAHGIISATTYGRRVQLATVLGVAGEADDDGNAAVEPEVKLITEEQAADLQALIDEVDADKKAFLKACKIDTLEHLPATKLAGAIARLEKKRKAG